MGQIPLKKATPSGVSTEPNDRREEILEAATVLFAEEGFTDSLTQQLADRLGVGKGTLYRYFPSKSDLFLAAVDRLMKKLTTQADQNLEDVTDPLDRISIAVRTYHDFFENHPEFAELLVQERAQFKDRAKPTYFAHRETRVERWRELYRSLIKQGRVRDIPVNRITDVISAAVYGSMFLNHFGGRDESFAASADDILDIIFHGILTREASEDRAAIPTAQPGAADPGGCHRS